MASLFTSFTGRTRLSEVQESDHRFLVWKKWKHCDKPVVRLLSWTVPQILKRDGWYVPLWGTSSREREVESDACSHVRSTFFHPCLACFPKTLRRLPSDKREQDRGSRQQDLRQQGLSKGGTTGGGVSVGRASMNQQPQTNSTFMLWRRSLTPCDVLMFYSNDGSVLILIWLSAFWQSRLVSSLHQRAGESLLWYILQEGRIKNQQWTSEAFISSQTRLLVLLLLTFKGPVCRIKTICWQRYMLPWSRSSSTESAMFLQEPRIDWNDPRGQIKYFALEKKKKRYWQNRTLALKRASLFEFLQLQRSV